MTDYNKAIDELTVIIQKLEKAKMILVRAKTYNELSSLFTAGDNHDISIFGEMSINALERGDNESAYQIVNESIRKLQLLDL